MPHLPESFNTPNGNDLDDLIDGLDEDIQMEGDASLFLGLVRYERRNSYTFSERVLRPMAQYALGAEYTDSDDHIIDRQHKAANAMMSGMIFGHLINEAVYPSLCSIYFPYHSMPVDLRALNHAQLVEFAEAGAMVTGKGRRIVHETNARIQLNALEPRSVETIDRWASDLIPSTENHLLFRTGVGFAMNAVWDTYTDQLTSEGREYTPLYVTTSVDSDQGSDTSI
jgi:hypothetical protein